MKKIARLGFLLTALLLTTACQRKEVKQSSSEVTTQVTSPSKFETSTERTSSTTAATQATTSAISQEISQATTSTPQVQVADDCRWKQAYAWSLEQIGADRTEGHPTYYAFYDIDYNGIKELITGHLSTNGEYYLAAIYYLRNGVSTYLAQSFVASAGGRRESAVIYTDGTVAYYYWHSASGDGFARQYRLNPDNSGHVILSEVEYQRLQFPDYDSGRVKLDIQTLNWQKF